jgi:hypothetical protein
MNPLKLYANVCVYLEMEYKEIYRFQYILK